MESIKREVPGGPPMGLGLGFRGSGNLHAKMDNTFLDMDLLIQMDIFVSKNRLFDRYTLYMPCSICTNQ